MIVVDTNILAYRLLAGPRHEEARSLARQEPRWAAPILWRSELRNVVSGYMRRGTMDQVQATNVIDYASACLLAGEHQVQDSIVFELVRRSKCTSYDCEFVALAQTLKVLLISEDAALLRSFPSTCRSLKDCLTRGLKL